MSEEKTNAQSEVVQPMVVCGADRECCEHNIQCSSMLLPTGETICAIC